jgi:DNA polymerase-3 subunit delta
VDEKAVAELVLETSGETVFAWTDQVMEGRLPEAIATLDHLIEGGDAALGMVALLARHVRILMRAKELAAGRVSPRELPARLGVPPFAVQRYVEQARRFTEARLTDAIGELARLDHDLKSTGLSPHLLLERAVRNLGTPY